MVQKWCKNGAKMVQKWCSFAPILKQLIMSVKPQNRNKAATTLLLFWPKERLFSRCFETADNESKRPKCGQNVVKMWTLLPKKEKGITKKRKRQRKEEIIKKKKNGGGKRNAHAHVYVIYSSTTSSFHTLFLLFVTDWNPEVDFSRLNGRKTRRMYTCSAKGVKSSTIAKKWLL